MADINTGDTVRLDATFTNVAGVATDPTTTTLTILINGSPTVLTYPTGIVKDSTGVFHYDLTIPTAEDFYEVIYRWAGSGAVTAAQEGMFYAVSLL